MSRKKMTVTPDAEEAPMSETTEMTDAEAIETLVRTDETHLTDDDVPVQVPVEGQEKRPTQGTNPQMFHVLSQIDDGVFVAWDKCHRCSANISRCTCKQGPGEPKYVTTWRLEYIAKRDKAASRSKQASELATTVSDGIETATEAVAAASEEDNQ